MYHGGTGVETIVNFAKSEKELQGSYREAAISKIFFKLNYILIFVDSVKG